jgi:hypothetical protein
MADSIKERMTTGWQQIKLEGGNRLTRIRELYRDASREAMPQSPAPSPQTASQVTTALRVTYAVAKAGWQGASDWYQQAAWETRAGELGTQAARQEQQIRQRLKQWLQTAAERL